MDILERLRSVTRLLRRTEEASYEQDDTLASEAADEIERLRVKFWEIIKLNPFHNATPPIDKQYYAQIIIEMINVANAALKEGE